MSSKRDEFSSKTKETLRARVSGRCSNPNCRVQTTAAETNSIIGIVNIGKAAHITAAAPGGPRYDARMSSEQRKSIENGIWLCSNHADEIDKDDKRYTVELLKQWKYQAEEQARKELGSKLPSENDAIHTLTTALTGLPSQSFLPRAIHNICRATEVQLEEIDPRFSANVSQHKNKTIFELNAKEPVDTELVISRNYKKQFEKDFKKLIDHAKKLTIPASELNITGNPIFINLIDTNGSGAFSLSPQPIAKSFIFKAWVVEKDSGLTHALDDFSGQLFVGKKSFSYEGETFNGLIKVKLKQNVDDLKKTKYIISYNFDFWNGKNVNELPYFSKSFNFLSCIVQDGEIHASLEMDGELIMSGKRANESMSFYSYYIHHKYIQFSRSISKFFNFSIHYKNKKIIDEEDYDLLEMYHLIAKGETEFPYKKKDDNSKLEITVNKENYDFLSEINNIPPRLVSISQTSKQDISIFEESFLLPGLGYDLTRVKLHLCESAPLKIGRSCTIVLMPEKGCKYVLYTT